MTRKWCRRTPVIFRQCRGTCAVRGGDSAFERHEGDDVFGHAKVWARARVGYCVKRTRYISQELKSGPTLAGVCSDVDAVRRPERLGVADGWRHEVEEWFELARYEGIGQSTNDAPRLALVRCLDEEF